MRRLITLSLSLAALLLVAGPAFAQNESITFNNGQPAITSQQMCIGPSASTCLTISTTGEVNQQVPHTDFSVVLPAYKNCAGDHTTYSTFAPTRVAANDWALSKLAGANTQVNIVCSLNSWLQRVGGTATAGNIRGVKISSVSILHRINTANIAATWGKIATVARANNTANDVGPDRATAPTLPTASQTNPYVTTILLTTPLYLPINTNHEINMEWKIETGVLARYDLYGIGVNYSVVN